ncbi:ATPase AAA [Pseudoscardovia radai]|uniref:ATPase AAA n=2 Tax=Pseudoscardovia radai TaxID=987066 RepID=A0A261EXE5_9BIFI|nr:proteasome ATPase [Pseudoscardovia radai]OZG51549.1 ATPase AAA [Pseudoscardovia radai]
MDALTGNGAGAGAGNDVAGNDVAANRGTDSNRGAASDCAADTAAYAPASPDMTSERGRYEARLDEMARRLDAMHERNHALAAALSKAGEQLTDARSRLNDLAHPPTTYAVFVRVDSTRIDRGVQRATAEVIQGARRMIVVVSPQVKVDHLTPGQSVLLNDNLVLVRAVSTTITGPVRRVRSLLGADRLLVDDSSGARAVVLRGGGIARRDVAEGDDVLLDASGHYAVEVLPRYDANDLVLEEAPDVTFADIGGLDEQIERIRDAVEMPFLHRDLYERYGLKPPQGVLLYGPPGNGKTLIAKAIANALSKGFMQDDAPASQAAHAPADPHALSAAQTPDTPRSPGVFLSVKGPEILSKYVGEAERTMRSVFARARERAARGVPVIVFIDEIDSLLRTRGSGVSSDIETTIVPQFLTELDGIESLDNVIVIGASNRVDMIDPAVLRPGRLDVKIRIDRPGPEQAVDILRRYITTDLPIDENETPDSLINAVVTDVYEKSHRRHICAVYDSKGVRSDVYLGNLCSGAMLASIVNRAKMAALKHSIANGGESLITRDGLLQAVQQEFAESSDAASQAYTSQNVQQWARIAGIGDNVSQVLLSTGDAALSGGASFLTDGGIK